MLELALKTITLYFVQEWRFVPNGHLACNETLPYQDFITSWRPVNPFGLCWRRWSCLRQEDATGGHPTSLGRGSPVVLARAQKTWTKGMIPKDCQEGWFEWRYDIPCKTKNDCKYVFRNVLYIYIQNMKYVIHNQFYDMYTATHIFVFKYQKVIQ